MNIHFEGLDGTHPLWRLNTHMLLDQSFVEFVSNKIDFFISTNSSPEISASLFWEALKAFLRGEIISYISHKTKLNKKRRSEITQKITQLDNILAVTPSPDIYKERQSLQAEFDILSTSHAENLLLRTKSRYYEEGDKAGRLLALQLRQESTSHLIPQIRTPSGITTDPILINNHFKNYYTSLYASEQTVNSSDFDNFFSTLNIPTVNSNLVDQLEVPINIEELIQAATSLQCGKCPGPDGYPVEFYKKFMNKLAPILIEMYNESLKLLKLPQTLNQASISLILKKNKDPLECSSYRPVSLLNVDFKLLSKLLSMRLESMLPSVISPDQTGFIKSRHSFFNIRRLCNVVYNSSSPSTPEAVISLDAEKAFDRVEWGYLFYTLKKFGFGENFISWVKLLYSAPQASVRTNNTRSEYFNLHRSTRQGCPLSPLLFAIAIEPLSTALKVNPLIKGITRIGTEQKVSLYLLLFLLYISDFTESVPAVLNTLHSFSSISGYKLNLTKSEFFPLNSAAKKHPLHTLPFKIAQGRFKYLGVWITNRFQDLFKFNFDNQVQQVQKDFERWSVLPLSLAGRIKMNKMNILPKFSYLFQCIPIFLPQSFFRRLDGLISEFIWNKKTARICKALLQRPKSLGGMALPNFQYYYWAANFRVFQYWLNQLQLQCSPMWLTMEVTSCLPTTLTALLHSPINCSYSLFTKNVVVKTSLRIWRQFRRFYGLQAFSMSVPIASNFVFPPSMMDRTFSQWATYGISTFKDLYIDDVFASFQQLSDKFSMPQNNFFRYLQVRSFIRDKHPQFPSLPTTTPLDSFLEPRSIGKGMISYIYDKICSLHRS
uniref:Reverse transcriptase domain-containing protein n=1 Tax=Sinocyclocheilus rhinocerous TaxID=307959 RepID=A0A673FPW0_9TELE